MAVCDDVWVTVVSWISQDSYLKPLSSSDDLLIGGVFVSQTPLIPHPDNDKYLWCSGFNMFISVSP